MDFYGWRKFDKNLGEGTREIFQCLKILVALLEYSGWNGNTQSTLNCLWFQGQKFKLRVHTAMGIRRLCASQTYMQTKCSYT